ncbi:Kinesin-Like Protein Kif27 [Manis pentadactyla]|nr:Kinesin-Like Protein Kif27 [Manis pentadactyla]
MATDAPPLSRFLPPPSLHIPGPHVLTHTHARTHARSARAGNAGGRWAGGCRSSSLCVVSLNSANPERNP